MQVQAVGTFYIQEVPFAMETVGEGEGAALCTSLRGCPAGPPALGTERLGLCHLLIPLVPPHDRHIAQEGFAKEM